MVFNNKSPCSNLATIFSCFNFSRKTVPIHELPPFLLSKRFIVVVVIFLCYVVSQILRNHMNVTVIEMTSNKSIIQGNSTIVQPAEYNWDSVKVTLVMNIFSYGGLFAFFGGYFVTKFGGSVTCSICMIVSGIMTLLHPMALQMDFNLFLACRFVTGLAQTIFYISALDIYSQWFPLKERSKLVSFSFNGSNAGVACAYIISGYVSQRWSWQTVFYTTGVLAMIMSVICYITVRNKPCQDRRISRTELDYILEGTNSNKTGRARIPYKHILTSGPVWALCCLTFTYMWIATNVGVTLPLYVKDLTDMNTYQIGLASSIPSIVYTLIFPVAGIMMDYYNNHKSISLTKMHKILIFIAFLSSSIFFTASTFLSNFSIILGFFVFIDALMSTSPLIIEISAVNLSPQYSSIISSLSIFFLSVSAIVASTITGFVISDHSDTEWNQCYYLTSIISILGMTTFIVFGSSEAQKWSSPSTDNTDTNVQMK